MIKNLIKIVVLISITSSFAWANNQESSSAHSTHAKNNMSEHLNMDGMHKYLTKIQQQLDQIKIEKSAEKQGDIMKAMQKNMQRLHRQMEKMLVEGMAHIPMAERITMMEKHLGMMSKMMSYD
jgi:hypothetical protein